MIETLVVGTRQRAAAAEGGLGIRRFTLWIRPPRAPSVEMSRRSLRGDGKGRTDTALFKAIS